MTSLNFVMINTTLAQIAVKLRKKY